MAGFVVEICDPATGEITDQLKLDESSRPSLAPYFDVDAIARGVSFQIDSELMAQIATVLDQAGEEGHPGRIRMRRWFDDLPYQLHTGRELAMMLAGKKPLAVFGDDMPDVEESGIVPTRIFEPYLASGAMVRRDRVFQLDGVKCRDVIYAMAGEAWRIDAYLLLVEIAGRNGWSESLERMQGRLLGYSDEENDAYIDASASQMGTGRNA